MQKAAIPDAETEDGEVDKVSFDSNQFISYPGFNAPLPDGYIDVRIDIFDNLYYHFYTNITLYLSFEGLKLLWRSTNSVST